MVHEWQQDQYIISTDKQKLNLEIIHGFLRTSYWAQDIPRSIVEHSITNSLTFGVYLRGETGQEEQQIGFARVITDYATFAYLSDVFILEPFRNRGLSKWLIETIISHPELQGLRRWLLGTRDAHGLYQKFGFAPLKAPARFMERHFPRLYANRQNATNQTSEHAQQPQQLESSAKQ